MSKTLALADAQVHKTDFAAMGLHNPSPFDILSRPRNVEKDYKKPVTARAAAYQKKRARAKSERSE